MTAITPTAALRMYQMINKGVPLGVDSDGNVIHADTSLGTCMEMVGAKTYVAYSYKDANWQNNGRHSEYVYDVKEQVAFLREWANALELFGPSPTVP